MKLMASFVAFLRQGALLMGLLAALSGAAMAAEGDEAWAEWTYRWDKLTVVVRTNAGIYSPTMQKLGMAGTGATSPAKLMELARDYFVMTSAPRVDHTFEFIEPLARQWGPGHALPIVAAVALENLQRPIPTMFGGRVATSTFGPGGALRAGTAGGIDPQIPGVLRIVVYGQPLGFRRAAERTAHASAKAYYDVGRNEVGLLLDMAMFNQYYGFHDKRPGDHPGIVSAFIAYAMDAFNEDSGHELAHVAQQQSRHAAYALPAIREGEAEVQGLTRRRNGLHFNFLYNTPEAWFTGRFDGDVLKKRVEVSSSAGRPMLPMEVDRLVALKALYRSGRALTVSQLLGLDTAAFFSGTPAAVESRYAQAWALCLMAIRDRPVAQKLIQAVDARLAEAPRPELEDDVDKQLARFVDDPHHLLVTKQKAWQDAERFYNIDPVFAGVFYTWIHVIDPTDMKAVIYIGDALYAGRNLHGAMRYYLAARQLDGASALPLLRIGDVYSDIGDREEALRQWRAAEATKGASDDEAQYRRLAKERPAAQTR